MACCKRDDPRWRPTENKHGHEFGVWREDKYESCRRCGIIRRRDDKNGECRGDVKVELRDETT